MSLGEKILKLRKKNGLSQEKLGELIGVTRQTISNWELNETTPSVEELKKISKELNISIDELLDNDIKNVLVEKVSNTEALAGLILKVIKLSIIVLIAGLVIVFLLLILLKVNNKSKDTGRLIEESIYCKIYGEEHGYSIKYQELTGLSVEEGGDTYFYDILDLGKYNDAHQKFNVINDYVKKNGGTCEMVKDRDLNDIVDMEIKEGSLSKTKATIIIKEKEDYNISYGEKFWLEKYNYSTSSYEKLENTTGKNCAFNLPAYNVTPDKPLELVQDWSCMHGELEKGTYKLVKDAFFNSDTPVSESDIFYIWTEFVIE